MVRIKVWGRASSPFLLREVRSFHEHSLGDWVPSSCCPGCLSFKESFHTAIQGDQGSGVGGRWRVGVRNAEPQAPPQTYWMRICILTRSPGSAPTIKLEKYCSSLKRWMCTQQPYIFSWNFSISCSEGFKCVNCKDDFGRSDVVITGRYTSAL